MPALPPGTMYTAFLTQEMLDEARIALGRELSAREVQLLDKILSKEQRRPAEAQQGRNHGRAREGCRQDMKTSGLTMAKLKKAKAILKKNECPDRFMVSHLGSNSPIQRF